MYAKTSSAPSEYKSAGPSGTWNDCPGCSPTERTMSVMFCGGGGPMSPMGGCAMSGPTAMSGTPPSTPAAPPRFVM